MTTSAPSEPSRRTAAFWRMSSPARRVPRPSVATGLPRPTSRGCREPPDNASRSRRALFPPASRYDPVPREADSPVSTRNGQRDAARESVQRSLQMKRRDFLVGAAVSAASVVGLPGRGRRRPPRRDDKGARGTGRGRRPRPRSGAGRTGEARAHLADDAEFQFVPARIRTNQIRRPTRRSRRSTCRRCTSRTTASTTSSISTRRSSSPKPIRRSSRS